jgi:hypothetical protein
MRPTAECPWSETWTHARPIRVRVWVRAGHDAGITPGVGSSYGYGTVPVGVGYHYGYPSGVGSGYGLVLISCGRGRLSLRGRLPGRVSLRLSRPLRFGVGGGRSRLSLRLSLGYAYGVPVALRGRFRLSIPLWLPHRFGVGIASALAVAWSRLQRSLAAGSGRGRLSLRGPLRVSLPVPAPVGSGIASVPGSGLLSGSGRVGSVVRVTLLRGWCGVATYRSMPFSLS